MYDETLASKPVGKESELFCTLNRIDKKLENLRNVLSPIICDTPTEAKDTASTTELNGRLGSIEGKIARLLDTIQL